MRKADIAEEILSMTTTRERAATIAGDLSEEAASHGPFWFWGSLARVTASFVWRAWADESWRMARLGIEAFILNQMVFFILFLPLAMLSLMNAASVSRSPLIDVIAAFGASNLSLVVSQFLTGRWLVRRAPHRELPACGAYWVVGIAVGAAFFVALLQYGAIERTDLAMQPMVSLASNAFLFLGIARQKAVRVG